MVAEGCSQILHLGLNSMMSDGLGRPNIGVIVGLAVLTFGFFASPCTQMSTKPDIVSCFKQQNVNIC